MAKGEYKEKVCPQCKKAHRRRGPFCSKSCSNLGRKPEVYQKVSEWMRGSEKGQEITFNLQNTEDTDPRIMVGQAQESNNFVSGGDLWTVDDNW